MSLFIEWHFTVILCMKDMWVNFIPFASFCLSQRHQTEQSCYNRQECPKSSWRAKLSEGRGAWTCSVL